MTKLEATQWVQENIKSRVYKPLSEAQVGDWLIAAMRTDQQLASLIVRDMVQEGARLAVPEFNRRAKRARIATDSSPAEPPRYDPYIRCLEALPNHPTWQDREWFSTDQFSRSNQASKRYLTEYAAAIARDVQGREGGRWCGIVRQVDDSVIPQRAPQAKDQAEAHILDGPDGPGRRWLLKRQAANESTSPRAALDSLLKPVPPLAEKNLRPDDPDAY